MIEEGDDDDDARSLDEEDETYEVDEEWNEGDEPEDEDPDHLVFDAIGWFHADEETINAVDEMFAWEDDEHAQVVITYTEARNALARARIARGFYPVVVPADTIGPPRYGRVGGKSKGKGRVSTADHLHNGTSIQGQRKRVSFFSAAMGLTGPTY